MPSRRILTRILLSVLVLLVGFFGIQFTQPARAADATIVGLTLTPPSFDITVNPGDTVTETIRLRNQSNDFVRYVPVVERFTVEGSEGVPQLHQGEEDEPGNISKWFAFSDAEISLTPQQTTSTKFTLSIPKDAAPGSYFASIIYQAKSVGSSATTGAQVVQRVGSLMILTVRGSVTEKASVKSFTSRQYSGDWEESPTNEPGKTVLVSRNDPFKPGMQNKYINNGPIAFDLYVQNEGNVNVRPVGTVAIYNIFGKKVAEQILDGKNVFPGKDRRMTIIWPEKNPWGFYYTAKFVAVFGAGNQPLIAEVGFFAFPWLPVVIGVLVLILLITARRRIALAIRVLTKGH